MNKASGGDGIPVVLFQTLNDDAVKVLHSICQQIWKTQQWPQGWKISIFIPIPKKGNAKKCPNHTIALISHASLVAQRVEHFLQFRRPGFDPRVGKIPWRRERLPTPVILPGEFPGLVGYSWWGRKESDATECLTFFSLIKHRDIM